LQDEYIRSVLGKVKTIAMIGASANWKRPSYFAMSYLQVGVLTTG
jgi:predicted CoA-binding protein